ncbi:hypothetical protein PQX77_013715 [Marasmius sp. AFHP31]|nr:hypothetical protein PQX77_013715 [Marasmius sp. AFHP31]
MANYNTHTGSGHQNNNNAGTQNIHYGDHIVGEEVKFVNHYNATARNPHKSLWDAIAGVGASHKAEQQFSRGECLPGTRETALEMVYDWRTAKRQPLPMCWLSGAAGVGKSAIAMSVARSAENDGLVATFFFFRSDPRRNNPSALVLSIAHGLTVSKRSLKIAIEKRIADDPAILEARLEEQFRELVLKPCMEKPIMEMPRRRWWDRLRAKWEAMKGIRPTSDRPASARPVLDEPALIILDGLDECDEDETQLRVLSIIASSYQQSPSFPLRFLICSRPESWIRGAFRRAPLSQLTKHIVLDESFLPSRDIERYYLHAFKEIRERPENDGVDFSNPWPSEADLEILVQKSSGQFVYATTAVKLIGLRCSNPTTQLKYILSYTPNSPSSESSSFPELDRLYHIILSFSPNNEKLVSVLAAIFILPPLAPSSPKFIELVLGLPSGEVGLTLRFMHSVLNIGGGDVAITAYHTSFTDFLHDRSRSGQFYIDRVASHDVLACQWLRTLTMQVQENPDIILNTDPSFLPLNLQRLLKTWVHFCLVDDQPAKEIIEERDNFLQSVLSTFPDQQKLLTNLGAVILLGQLQLFPILVLGHECSLMTKSLEACQLATWHNNQLRLEPFFGDFLQQHDIKLPNSESRDYLAQQWIQALVPNNLPISW